MHPATARRDKSFRLPRAFGIGATRVAVAMGSCTYAVLTVNAFLVCQRAAGSGGLRRDLIRRLIRYGWPRRRQILPELVLDVSLQLQEENSDNLKLALELPCRIACGWTIEIHESSHMRVGKEGRQTSSPA